jgi:hypothetical protein
VALGGSARGGGGRREGYPPPLELYCGSKNVLKPTSVGQRESYAIYGHIYKTVTNYWELP